MSNNSVNNKRIAKNTLLLYVRMFFVMAVTLFTSRVVLATLGVTDFGIYNVVGGVVAMMGILNNAMAVSTQRYLTFELGRGDAVRLKQVFCMCLAIFVMLAVVVVVLGETVGLWFLNSKMTIPADRMVAANWVYLLLVIPVDRLTTYGLLILLSQIVIAVIYMLYCTRHFAEARYRVYWDGSLFRELVSYSGWNLFGSAAGVVKGQGLNILLNMFFTPAVNAARGIAYQVNAAITQFFTNFYTAVRPQITKYYAQGDMEEMTKLIFRSSKMSFYLIMLISMPVIIEAPYIVSLWLGQLPEYVVPFTRLIIAISAIDAMASPLMTAAHATGHIRLYQSSVGTMVMLNIPVSYVFLRLGFPPLTVFYVSLAISVVCLFMRLWIVRRLMPFPVKEYVVRVFGTSLAVCTLATIAPVAVHIAVDGNIHTVLSVCALSLLSCAVSIYYVGLDRHERKFVAGIVRKKILHKQ